MYGTAMPVHLTGYAFEEGKRSHHCANLAPNYTFLVTSDTTWLTLNEGSQRSRVCYPLIQYNYANLFHLVHVS